MIVVDVNVVAYFLIEGEKTGAARELLRREPDWRLPALWRHEYLNVLATFAREGGATPDEARALWRQGIELFGSREQHADMEAALELAAENHVSAYDAQYVALARQLGTFCVTEDQRLLKTFPSLTCTMRTFGAPETGTAPLFDVTGDPMAVAPSCRCSLPPGYSMPGRNRTSINHPRHARLGSWS